MSRSLHKNTFIFSNPEPKQTELLSKTSRDYLSSLSRSEHKYRTPWTPARSNRQPRGTRTALQEPLQMHKICTGSNAGRIVWTRRIEYLQ